MTERQQMVTGLSLTGRRYRVAAVGSNPAHGTTDHAWRFVRPAWIPDGTESSTIPTCAPCRAFPRCPQEGMYVFST